MSRPPSGFPKIGLKLTKIALPQYLGRIVVIWLGRHLKGQREKPPPTPWRVVTKVPQPGRQRRAALRDEMYRNPQAPQNSERTFGSCPVSHDHTVDRVGLDPLRGEIAEVVHTDDPPGHHAFRAADGHPTLFHPRIDGQHPQRNVTMTGPIV